MSVINDCTNLNYNLVVVDRKLPETLIICQVLFNDVILNGCRLAKTNWCNIFVYLLERERGNYQQVYLSSIQHNFKKKQRNLTPYRFIADSSQMTMSGLIRGCKGKSSVKSTSKSYIRTAYQFKVLMLDDWEVHLSMIMASLPVEVVKMVLSIQVKEPILIQTMIMYELL